jgi:hypothetical protein
MNRKSRFMACGSSGIPWMAMRKERFSCITHHSQAAESRAWRTWRTFLHRNRFHLLGVIDELPSIPDMRCCPEFESKGAGAGQAHKQLVT